MSDDDSLLGKADQLMRRHRSFVATPKSADSEAADSADDDLPVLTEVVVTASDQAAADDNALRLRLEQLLVEQRAAMLSEFERWLDEQLPQVVISAMDGMTDRLVSAISRRARAELLPRLEAIAAATGEQARALDGKEGGQPV